MKQITLTALLVAALAFACSDRDQSDSKTAKQPGVQNSKTMKNLVSIVEIPTDSFQRATKFYQSILNVSIQAIDMQGTQMGLFPCVKESVNVALVHGEGYKPSDRGTLIYLNGGEDLQTVLDKVEANGGKVIIQKTEIDPENGFFATFLDTEGNRLGLHSYK